MKLADEVQSRSSNGRVSADCGCMSTTMLLQVAEIINTTYPDSAIAIRTDVASEESVKNAVEEVVNRFGRMGMGSTAVEQTSS